MNSRLLQSPQMDARQLSQESEIYHDEIPLKEKGRRARSPICATLLTYLPVRASSR